MLALGSGPSEPVSKPGAVVSREESQASSGHSAQVWSQSQTGPWSPWSVRSDIGMPHFPGFPHRSDSPHRPWSILPHLPEASRLPAGVAASLGVGASRGWGCPCSEKSFLGGGLGLWTPSLVRQPWCSLELRPEIQKRDLLHPGCRRKLQETMDFRGLWEMGVGWARPGGI